MRLWWADSREASLEDLSHKAQSMPDLQSGQQRSAGKNMVMDRGSSKIKEGAKKKGKASPYYGRQRYRYLIHIRQGRTNVVTILGTSSEPSRIRAVK